MKIIVASNNDSKIEGVRRAFASFFNNFRIIGIGMLSEIDDRPFDEDNFKSADSRLSLLKEYCAVRNEAYDYYITVETGVFTQYGRHFFGNVVLIEDSQGYRSYGIGACFELKEEYVKDIIEKRDCPFVEYLFNESNIKNKNGGIYKITKGRMFLYQLVEQATNMALIKQLNENLR